MTFPNLARPLAVIDSEWSDGAPATARLVSLGIARHEPDGTQTTGYWLVNPMTPISAEATEVHGIRDQDVAGKPPFEDVAADVSPMLTACDLAGYGVRGDLLVIELEMQRAGLRWSPTGAAIIDGLRMWQLLEPRKLGDAYKKFVGPLPKTGRTHHAAFDVELTTAVIAALQRNRTIEEIHDQTNENMVDVAGKFRLDQGKRTVFAFGPYRGAVATDHPDYLEWMLRKDFPPSTLDVARRLLDEHYEQPAEADAMPATAPTYGCECHRPDDDDELDDDIPF